MKWNSLRPKQFVTGLFLFSAVSGVHAIEIAVETDANALASALTSSGVTVTSSSISGFSTSSGTFSNVAGTYGIGSGIVLSTGDVRDYETGLSLSSDFTTNYGVAATASQELLLDPITGGLFDHNDVTQFDLTFDVDNSIDRVFFNVVFGSEEFSEFIGTSFIDAFGIYLNGVNIATFLGLPVNVNHPDMVATPGTELDGILDPTNGLGDAALLFSGIVTPGSIGNTLTFIIADSGDSNYDSTVYISNFGSENPGGNPGGGNGTVPAPATLALLGLGLLGMRAMRKVSVKK